MGGQQIDFTVASNGSILALPMYPGATPERDDAAIAGFYVLPLTAPSELSAAGASLVGQRCPAPEQYAVFQNPSMPPKSESGCGNLTGIESLVPETWFTDCCGSHDMCYSVFDKLATPVPCFRY